METIYADTWNELTVKMLGYYHDHCHHYYCGLAEGVPKKFLSLITENKKFVFIYEEDEPYETKVSNSEN